MNKTSIANWLVPGEKLEDYLEEEIFIGHHILVITSERAILLHVSLFKTVQEKSDRLWERFVGVHLEEGLFSARMTLKFSRRHATGHNGGRMLMDDPWVLVDLRKQKAHQVHLLLKEKELSAKHERTEKRHQADKNRN